MYILLIISFDSLKYNASIGFDIRHRWLSDMTDTPPTVKPPLQHRWMIDHIENKTGTQQRYVPYSTTRAKIQSWQPPAPSK